MSNCLNKKSAINIQISTHRNISLMLKRGLQENSLNSVKLNFFLNLGVKYHLIVCVGGGGGSSILLRTHAD